MRTYSLFIHHAGASTPTLMLEVVDDDVTLKSLAERALGESPSRLAVEIREEDRLVFSLDRNGVVWSRSARELKRQRSGVGRYAQPNAADPANSSCCDPT
jgi:hypothetical protein